MASSKSLIRAGVSLMTRFLNPNPNPANQLLSRSSRTIAPPKFLPYLFIPQSHTTTPLHFQLHVNDDVALSKLSNEGFLYPSGLPYLPFFLPTADEPTSSEPILLFPKRTYQVTSGAKGHMDSLLGKHKRRLKTYCSEHVCRKTDL